MAKYDYDLTHAIALQQVTVMSYGSEFRPEDQLDPLLQHHPNWQHVRANLCNGVKYNAASLPEEERRQMLETMIEHGNQKSATTAEAAPAIEKLVREDIGRHNAVDKVFGRMLLDGRLPLEDPALVISGRAGFEIVQKACVAEVPFVIAVSAPSSMAVELAKAVGITLIGFARNGTFRVYCHPERVG